MFLEHSFFQFPKTLTNCCIQVSKQRAVTNLCEDVWKTRRALGDGGPGVKQLSSLAAPGGKMLLNQEGVSNSSSLQGNSKPQGQRSLRAAMEAICLVVRAQQVSPGQRTWLLKTSHPVREKKNTTIGMVSGMSTTHTSIHSPHTRHNNPCLRSFYPEFTLCLLCRDVRKMLNCADGEKTKRITEATISVCFCVHDTLWLRETF